MEFFFVTQTQFFLRAFSSFLYLYLYLSGCFMFTGDISSHLSPQLRIDMETLPGLQEAGFDTENFNNLLSADSQRKIQTVVRHDPCRYLGH